MIEVTRPFLPPKEEYEKYLSEVWERNWLTNNGPLVNELELQLKKYLGINHLLYLNNGTIAIQIAIKALGLKGGIITTPFSYVATTSSIVWESCVPVFVDIDKDSFNINPDLIEAAITPNTTGILATHVYGNPCDVVAIDKIAKKHNLKVIYDGAHCFGTTFNGKSILNYGDVSTISFHATKLFHTVEGGAVVTNNPEVLRVMARMRNFGHNGPDKFDGVGINGKNSEFHAAMGLVNLKYASHILEKRKKDHAAYDTWLNQLNLQKPSIMEGVQFNHSYYPVVFDSEETCVKVFEALAQQRISARRYFYPVLSNLNYVEKQTMPVADEVSRKILCLPLFEQLKSSELDMICRIILRTVKN